MSDWIEPPLERIADTLENILVALERIADCMERVNDEGCDCGCEDD